MAQIVDIAPGVQGMFIENKKFKTTRISVSFFLALQPQTVSANAILPYVLASSSREFPDTTALNRRLNELYGAVLHADSDKIGDSQVLKLSISVIDDKYSLDSSPVISKAAELLAGIIFEPNFENNNFRKSEIERERRLLLERIEGEINDKRLYAKTRCEAEMCKNEPYGLPKLGTAESAKNLSADDVYAAWQRALKSSYIRINIVGEALPEGIWDSFKAAFSAIIRDKIGLVDNIVIKSPEKVKEVTDELNIQQGKLVMGFRTGIGGGDNDTAALMVVGDLFGGGPYSRLFQNLRERLSLCYYCSARTNRRKGILLVESGIEKQNVEKARQEILNQLEILKKGEFEDSELSSSVMSITDSLSSVTDTPAQTDYWYINRVFDKEPWSPERLSDTIRNLKKEDIVKAAQAIELDTVYMLSPKQ